MADCCTDFQCSGTDCVEFSLWTFIGADETNTDNCILYASCDTFGTSQQIEIYKDVAFTSLVAIGQRTGIGIITLDERNSSGLTGTVQWTGNLIPYPSFLTLFCKASSSSDSSSSLDSSSSSSSSSSIDSSSSESSDSLCCINPICVGSNCTHFSTWIFSGMTHGNTDNCILYVVFDEVETNEQQVRIYSDAEFASLVAAGQRLGLGTITLSQRNSSGLSGTVTWDGVFVTGSVTAILDCDESSSSSSSSFSSLSSSSSSSSSLTSDSSSSSSSSISSSSSSSQSSSSSSIDSSSESSESIGNFSSSSSSSLVEWNKIKPLIFGMSSVNSATIKNRLAQTIYIIDETYSIGTVYCYLYGSFGNSTAFTVHLEVHLCDDTGKPLVASLSSKMLAGTSITQDGWYSFDIDIDGVTPANKYLSFVMWQENGDEDNYVLWGYNYEETNESKTWFSNDALTWTEQEGVLRALKVVGSFDAYDLTNFKLLTPAAEQQVVTKNLLGATLSGLKLVPGEYGYDVSKVIVDHPDFLCSFVIDSSGSMGWNDRYGSRTEMVQSIIDRFKTLYPSSSRVLFDVLKFGAIQLDTDTIISDLSRPMTINLDLNNSTRTTYVFTTASISAQKDTVYKINNINFTVLHTVTTGDLLFCSGEEDPPSNGTLQKVSGIGDLNIIYTLFTSASVSDKVVAFGFKNLENDHTYNIGEVVIDSEVIDSMDNVDNWQAFLEGGGPVSLTSGSNGPSNSKSMDIVGQNGLVLRRPFCEAPVATTSLLQNISKGDMTIYLENPELVAPEYFIDFVDGDFATLGHQVTTFSTGNSYVEISTPSEYDIQDWAIDRGIAQVSTACQARIINGTTAKLLVRDITVTRSITFFMQTADGLMIEWDFQPFSEWILNDLYWLGETALLPVSIFDSDGDPLPDGTKVEFYIGSRPSEEPNEVPSTDSTVIAPAATNRIYVISTTGYVINDNIDIISPSGNLQNTTVLAVGTDTTLGPYIETFDLLQFTFEVGTKVVEVQDSDSASGVFTNSTLLPSSVALVDTTPIFTGKSLDTSLLEPYDPTPVLPGTPYSDLNLDRERIQMNINDIPTIDGYGTIRVLPITEDNLKTIKEKRDEGEYLFTPEPPEHIIEQSEQNTGDIETAQTDEESAVGMFTTTTTTLLSRGEDYEIDNPVYLSDGFAESSIVSFATDLTPTIVQGANVAGIDEFIGDDIGTDFENQTILIKNYEIFPAVVMKNTNNITVAKQYLNSFDVDFTPPINIEGIYDETYGGAVKYISDNGFEGSDDPCPGRHKGYSTMYAPGVYASDSGFKINYIITDKEVLIKDGSLKIKIYSSPVTNIDDVVAERASFLNDDGNVTAFGRAAYQQQNLNIILPSTVTTASDGTVTTTQPLSTIDQWRDDVANNPFTERIEDVAQGGSQAGSNLLESLVGLNVSNQFIEDIEKFGYQINNSDTIISPAFQFYTKPKEWTKATQYGDASEQTLSIVNGRAVLEIPASDTNSLLMVEASVAFGETDQFETVQSNLVVVSNPINIDIITPDKIFVEGDNTYEISTQITWLSQIIEDNVVVNFTPEETDAIPSVSKTNNGLALGVKIGPHSPVIMTKPMNCDSGFGQYEYIIISVNHMGYERIIKRIIEWTSSQYESEGISDDEFPFLIKKSGIETGWADGTTNIKIESDLTDVFNQLWVTESGIKALKGKNQPVLPEYPNGTPRRISWDARGLTIKPDQERWETDTVSAHVFGGNANVGHMQPSSSTSCCPRGNAPWSIPIKGSTGYGILNDQGKIIMYKRGIGVKSTPYPCGIEANTCWPRVELTFREPLGIEISIESYDAKYIRDGVDSPNIVAEVTWKGQPITSKFTVNEGAKDETIKDFPFPDVVLKAGTCSEGNAGKESGEMKDNRNIESGCLTIASHIDVNLDAYTAVVSLSRTDIYSDANGSHTHACQVDYSGDGTTTSTIILSGVTIADHTHTISNYIALSAGSPAHTHSLRSVAIVKILPSKNIEILPTINGYVEYNPTAVSSGRMMFATLYLPTGTKRKELLLTLSTASDILTNKSLGNAYTAETVIETIKGFDIKAFAKFSSYTVEVSPGNFVFMPEEVVPDGSRMIFDIKTYRPSEIESDLLVVGTDQVREYMYISIIATIISEGMAATKNVAITVLSDLQWLPSVKRLVADFTEDSIYIAEALGQINTLGASQIHDAVKLSAQNIIQYQTDNSSWKTSKKAIFLLTDGDENTSGHSIGQAIDNVNFIDGSCEVPVIPVKLGYSYSSDVNILRKYADETCGKLTYLVDGVSSDIVNLIDDIITDGVLKNNDGIYSDIIDLGAENLPIKITADNVSLPAGTRILFRSRFSTDGNSWSNWSEWYNSSQDIDFELNLVSLGRYFQYQIHLYGNENFESPELYAGAELTYYKSQLFTTFFQPVDIDINTDEYLASIHITHEATIPSTSQIEYGYTQFDTTDFDDYYSTTRPMIIPDRHTIILTRYNEKLLTKDRQTYTAINYGWPDQADIEIYRINKAIPQGQLIDSSEYAVNNKLGTIQFENIQEEDEEFVLCVYFEPTFRILCNVKNYGPESIVIDHIGLLYNISKRIPKDNNGNVIHVSANERV